ncbi:unnamed protein product [Rhizoctonia solani]|uniref:RING-type domain-containing protein n=1 Tax=Rhizoctonia solani TaxID=456999 RepID=A0A8H3D7W0_9AGAM|nr:unnamed protein product [Rhizoctonia solani]
MPVGIEAWLTEVPPITRAWMVLSVATSVAVQCQMVTPVQLYFSFGSAFGHMQPWRLLTTFLYFGPLSLDFVFHIFFFMRYSRMLEESSFANRPASYFWLLLTSSVFLVVVSPLFTLPFLSSPLGFVPIYVWSRRHPTTQISLFGLVTITAPYLPLALVGFSWIINGTWKAAAGDLVGCAVGHIGWFVRDVWTREAMGGETFLSAPPEAIDTSCTTPQHLEQMADREKLLEDILGVLPDMNPPWLQYQIALHLAIDPDPSHTQMRILDSAFAHGYVKVAEQPALPGIPPIPQHAVAAPVPPPLAHPPPVPSDARAGEKRKAPEPAVAPDAKRRAIGKTVDFTQTIRPFVQGRDFKYQELSLSYLNAKLVNLPMNYIRRQFHKFQYLVPAYLAVRQELAAGSLNGVLLKKRRYTTGPYGAECEPSPLFVAEKRALDAYIASGCKDMNLLCQAAPPQEIEPVRPRTPSAPSSQSSSRSNTPIAGPSQSSVPNSTQSSYTSVGSSVKRWGPPGQGSRAENRAHQSRSPSPLARQHGSRSPTPIEIETQATEASVLVIESQDSDVMVIDSQLDEPQLRRSPSPGPQPANPECGCCFSEYDFSEMLQCAEGHLFCPECTKKNAETTVGDNKPEILCMDLSGCHAPFPDEQLQRVLSPKTLDLLQRIRQKKDIDDAGIRGLEHCPFCDYAYIIADNGPTFLCQNPSCMAVSCRKCRRVEHGGKSCEEVTQKEKSSQGEHAIAEAMTMALVRDCPECKTPFMKESGCNKMNCPTCGTVSCYICRQRVSQISPYTHFDRDPDAYDLPPDRRKCPLWDIDRTGRAGGSPTRLHNEAVARAEREARVRYASLPKLNAPKF